MTAELYPRPQVIVLPYELGVNGDRRKKSDQIGLGQLWLRIAEGKRRNG